MFAGLIFTLFILAVQPNIVAEAQNNPKVYRIELRLETGTVDHSATDDKVYIKLNNGNITYLDHARNDFTNGSTYLYDLMLDEVFRLDDIRYLWIKKQGTNGWCVKRIELYVNRGLMYKQTWPGSQCRWIDGDDGHSPEYFVDGSWLDRSLPGQGPAYTTMGSSNIMRVIESGMGHGLAYTTYYWGSDGNITLRDVSANTIRVKATARVPRTGQDGKATMKFDLVISCNNKGNVSVKIQNPSVEHNFSFSISGEIINQKNEAMESARRYLRKILNRRVNNCNSSNKIIVTNGPEIRIT